jgi:hypothetical protein
LPPDASIQKISISSVPFSVESKSFAEIKDAGGHNIPFVLKMGQQVLLNIDTYLPNYMESHTRRQ